MHFCRTEVLGDDSALVSEERVSERAAGVAGMTMGAGTGADGDDSVLLDGNCFSSVVVGHTPPPSINARSPGLSSSMKRTSRDVMSLPVSTSSNL